MDELVAIRSFRLGDWTPSDSGPWLTEWANGRPHVMPGFGPAHQASMRCWCHPVVEDEAEPAVSHNVAH